MANGDDGSNPSWPSWLAPGDVRRAGVESTRQHLDSDAKRQSQERDAQSSQVGQQDYERSVPSTYTSNPLISFKHLVDKQLAAIIDLPSNVAELKRHIHQADAEHEAQRNAPYRWTGGEYLDASLKHRIMPPDAAEKAYDMAVMLIRESDLRNRNIPSEKIISMFEDTDYNPSHVFEPYSPWPFYHKAFANDDQESCQASDALSNPPPATPTRWLSINWFKHSPYSPVNLEVDTMLAKYETKWRSAFEDLLEASLDKPMTSRDRIGCRPFSIPPAISTWHGPGLDWMLSLQCRGILPPQLPSMYLRGWNSPDCWRNASFNDLNVQSMARAEFDQLIHEIFATTKPYYVFPSLGMSPAEEAKFGAEEAEFESDERICPRHADQQSSEDYAFEMSLAERNHRDQMSSYDEFRPSVNRCPDELGRVVGQAVRTEITELDLYEAQCDYARAQHRLVDHVSDGQPINAPGVYEAMRECLQAREQLQDLVDRQNGRQPMEPLDRLEIPPGEKDYSIDEAARQQAARAFADEENDLSESSTESRTTDMAFEDVCLRGISYLMTQVDRLRTGQDTLQRRIDQRALVEMQEAHEQKGTPRMLEQEAHVADRSHPPPLSADSNRPQILSTLTTTQTTRLPDGSVKTTVVLKRRFANGDEETQESSQTSFDEPAAVPNAVGQDPSKEGKSWFWS